MNEHFRIKISMEQENSISHCTFELENRAGSRINAAHPRFRWGQALRDNVHLAT